MGGYDYAETCGLTGVYIRYSLEQRRKTSTKYHRRRSGFLLTLDRFHTLWLSEGLKYTTMYFGFVRKMEMSR